MELIGRRHVAGYNPDDGHMDGKVTARGLRWTGGCPLITNATTDKRKLTDNLKRIRERVDAACQKGHRKPSEVKILAVTKYVDLDVIRQILDLGITDLGESRAQQLNQRAGMIQEFLDRKTVLSGRRDVPMARPRWHMVGHLQRNKVKLVVPWVEMIHSVDSLRLAEDLHIQAQRVSKTVDVLLQVNTSGEKSKFGMAVGAIPHLLEHLAPWNAIRVCGLMTMAPLDVPEMEVRLCFERLRDVFEDIRGSRYLGPHFKELSMGMSGDFEAAVEAGATIIRIGSLLFEGLANVTSHPSEYEDHP